jgi:RNA polymerase sigma factor (TIGR02999 family)
MNEVTRILAGVEPSDPHAADQLLPLVYAELRRLAAQKLAHEAAGHTLQPTALVHEAYLRLVDSEAGAAWDNRGHFFAAAAEAMRRILVDKARHKRSLKRGGDLKRHDLDEVPPALPEQDENVLAVSEALDKFTRHDPLKAELVKLRFFAGFSGDEAARLLNISAATGERYWAYARAWLHRAIKKGDE